MKRTFAVTTLLFLAACASTTQTPRATVARVWHGKVLTSRADEYERYLQDNGILALRATQGNLGAQLFRRAEGEVTHFVVISYWPSEDAIRAWAGDTLTKVRMLPRDPAFLIDPETEVLHFAIRADR